MTKMQIKKKLAALLSVVLLASSAAPAAFAQGVATPAEGSAQLITPIAPAQQTQKTVAAPGASVSVSGSAVSITVTGEAGLRMYVDATVGWDDEVYAGETVSFTGFEAGKSYDVEVDYYDVQQGVSAFRTSVKIPAASADDDQAPPPTSGGAEAITPPTSGGAEAITPPAGPAQFALAVFAQDGEITAQVSGASQREVSLTLLLGGKRVSDRALIGNGSVSFGKQGDGVYTVLAEYVTPAQGVVPVEKTVEIKNTGAAGSAPADRTPSVSAIGAAVSSGDDWIEVRVTDADPWLLYVAVGNDVKTVSVGESVRFSSLPAGEYGIEIDYVDPVSGVTPFRSSVAITKAAAKAISFSAAGGAQTIEVVVSEASTLPVRVTLLQGGKAVDNKTIAAGVGKVTFQGLSAGEYAVSVNYDPAQSGVSAKEQAGVIVTGKAAGITIAKVTAGENTITVTGTAQPNTDIALTTTPAASAATIVRSDKNGAFTAQITLQAGTYTQVRAVYLADNTVFAVKDGAFVVTAPSVRPDLTVDPVTIADRQVIAKTTPGVTVSLRVKDYGYAQTLVADSRGLLKFALPQTYPKGAAIIFTVYYGVNNAQSHEKTISVTGKVYHTLKYGDTGAAVEEMTDRLDDLGYLEHDTTRYSSEVREAVKLFQKINGLQVDGVCGPETLAVLFSVSAIPCGATGVYPTLARGDKGLTLIYTLQRRLKDLGYYTIAVDGIFGSGTERAVRHFQRINGLPKTGVADNATQQLLYSSSAKAADSGYADDYKELSRSKYYHPAVVPLQRRLKALGYEVGSVDGYFGSRTQRAVREFQRRNGLRVTGVADEAMQRVLFSSAARPASGSSFSPSVSSYRLLTWGSEGEDVVRLQKALLAAGYWQVRTADGIYGQWTYDAVRAFQKDRGLSVDGIAGRDTQNALYGTKY